MILHRAVPQRRPSLLLPRQQDPSLYLRIVGRCFHRSEGILALVEQAKGEEVGHHEQRRSCCIPGGPAGEGEGRKQALGLHFPVLERHVHVTGGVDSTKRLRSCRPVYVLGRPVQQYSPASCIDRFDTHDTRFLSSGRAYVKAAIVQESSGRGPLCQEIHGLTPPIAGWPAFTPRPGGRLAIKC